ncbi:MAG TPA: DUF5691 domain-containing protein [Microvirga sp.]|jgi:hypothetical protein|nr:DUF5691 domain-containing protein [Microvirga sp.]
MNSPLNPSERDNVIQSFLIGTGRRPFEAPAAFSGARPDAAILGALALAATERRFVRPLPDRPGSGTPPLPDDERPLLPAETRKALAMLLALQRRGDSKLLVSAAIDLVEGLGWRLHPFDLPLLRPALIQREARLGPVERAYLRATGHPLPEDAASVTEEEWEIAKPSERVRIVERMRAADPAAARSFLSERFKNEKPPQREALLDALSVGMSAEDRPFIEEVMNGDRSEPVRLKARHLLFLVPASEERQEVIRQLAAVFEVRRPAIPFMRKTMILRSKDKTPVERAVGARVTLNELAGQLRLTRSELLDMIPGLEAGPIWVLYDLATASQDAATFAAIAQAKAAIDWPTVIEAAEPCRFSLPERRAIVRSIGGFGNSIFTPNEWIKLRQFNGGPLAAAQANPIVGANLLGSLSAMYGMPDPNPTRWSGWPHIEAFAGLMPPAGISSFRREIATRYRDVPMNIGLYLDVVEAADRDARRSGIVPHYEEQE